MGGTRNKRATSLTLITPVERSLQIRAISTASDTIVSRVDDAFQVHHWALAERAHGYVSQSPARHASRALTSCRWATIPWLLRTLGTACSRNERFNSSCADVEPLRHVSRSQSRRRRLTCMRGWVCALRR